MLHANQARLMAKANDVVPETTALLRRIRTNARIGYTSMTIDRPSGTTTLELKYLGYRVHHATGELVHVSW